MQFWTKYFQSKYFHRGGGGKKADEEVQSEESTKTRGSAKGKEKDKGNSVMARVKNGTCASPSHRSRVLLTCECFVSWLHRRGYEEEAGADRPQL
jgi:hypothetical protein